MLKRYCILGAIFIAHRRDIEWEYSRVDIRTRSFGRDAFHGLQRGSILSGTALILGRKLTTKATVYQGDWHKMLISKVISVGLFLAARHSVFAAGVR